MKRQWMIALLAALMAGLLLCAAPAMAEQAEGELDEWTVLFYFCGSDLESKYGYATGNLEEIMTVEYPDSLLPLFAKVNQLDVDVTVEYPDTLLPLFAKVNQLDVDVEKIPPVPKVNVLIETGGAKQWHAEGTDLCMDIRPDALQRWRFQCYSLYGDDTINDNLPGFELVDTQPLRSMASPATLSDFIRWGVETCPAKKYALVLWDHGGGAKTGLFIDELFDGDVMYLHELRQALADGGATFETVIIDACLMANIETAYAVKDSARWMVASEEVVPGKGTAAGDWLQELYNHPECDGEQLGRSVCDMTQIKYANEDDEQARSILTWSVIDLTKVDRLAEVAGRFFHVMGQVYKDYPGLAITYASYIRSSEEFGDGNQDMRDIGGVFYDPYTTDYLDRSLRSDMLDALSDAVVYVVRGSGRSGARGLSFCYPVAASPDELDIYAKNCPSPQYLAYLDAVSDWSAPDSVYDAVERLPEIETVETLQLEVSRRIGLNDIPCITVSNILNNLSDVFYRLYRLDEETGQTLLLGRTTCEVNSFSDEGEALFGPEGIMSWPAIDGVFCDVEQVRSHVYQDDLSYEQLYNIPIQIGEDMCFLRCGYRVEYDVMQHDEDSVTSYEVYGVWEGYDETTQMTNRSVKDLAKLAGQNFHLIYPTDAVGEDGRRMFQSSDEALTMYRALDVEEIPLPAGTYFIEYEVDDMFERPFVLERIELHWDGETLTVPNADAWTGETLLTQNG